jgi:hypothetical protein
VRPGQRRHLVEGDLGLVGQHGADHAEARHHHGAAALPAGDELGEPDRAAGARHVGHLHAGRELLRFQALLEGAGVLVVAAARAGGGHDLDALKLRGPDGRRREGDRCRGGG